MTLAERFWRKVKIGKPNECWLWQAGTDKAGYGRFRFKGKNAKAHRIAFKLSGKRFVRRDRILHHCDNPPCCNQKHLFRGSQLTNVKDRQRKQRQATKANGRWKGGRVEGKKY